MPDSDVITPPAETPQPPPAQPPADPTPPDIGSSGAPPAPSAAVMTPNPVTPTHQMVTVQHRGGLAGIVDEFRNALAGPQTTQITTDENGNKVVRPVNQTPGQQWMKIAATAARGAGAGYAAGQGPGGGGRAVGAGFQVGDEEADQQRKQTRDQQIQARQENVDAYNQVKQKLDLAKSTFELKRLNATAGQEDIKFSQNQLEYEKGLGSIDLGLVPDAAHMSDAAKNDPKFFEHLYKDHSIVGVPEIGPNGERMGMHVFLRTTKPGDTIVPAGSPVQRFVMPTKPGDKPQIVTEKTAGPMKQSDLDAQNMAAGQHLHDWTSEQQKEQLTNTQIEEGKASIKVKNSEVVRNIAEASKANAESRKAKLEADMAAGEGSDAPVEVQAQMLVDGRSAPSQLNKRATNYGPIIARANALSMQQTGQGYDAAMGEARYKNYVAVVHDYMDGPNGQNIQSFDRFLGHAMETSNSVNAARNTNQPWLNTPLNKLETLTGSQVSPALQAYRTTLDTTRTEYKNFLNNNHALHTEDIKAMGDILDDSKTPAQIQAALTSMAKIAAVRLKAMDFSFSRSTHAHIPDLVSPDGARALQHFGVDPNSVYSTITPPHANMPAQGPNPGGENAPAKINVGGSISIGGKNYTFNGGDTTDMKNYTEKSSAKP